MNQDTAPLLKGDALESAAVACVLVHGRGQSPEAVDDHILGRLKALGVGYILPRAATGSWYDAKAVDALTDRTRQQLTNSLDQVRQCVMLCPPEVPVLLAGFSQGACIALEYAFRFGPWQGAVTSFTGCRVGEMANARPHADLAGMPVYLSGADADSWIPLSAFANAAQELGAARARLRADLFPGRPHEVTDIEISILDNALRQLASGQHVSW
jgi:phospholipase/carboxylesterase